MDMNFYFGLSVKLYDSFFPEIDELELNFYARHIAACLQPALEVGCGTGRLLLPLLERGLDVEGFDSSPDMLAVCKEKAMQRELLPVMYEQRMQDLALPKKYGCIFSALGTFQQLENLEDAQRALRTFYEHLLPCGRLFIYLYLPWHDAPTFGEWHQHDPVVADDTTIIVHEKSIHDPIEQLVYSWYRYEVWQSDTCITRQDNEQTIRWYSRYEFQFMLERAGFSDIAVLAGYDNCGPSDIMIFSAKK
jgi:SAM-dependent methyltransferase